MTLEELKKIGPEEFKKMEKEERENFFKQADFPIMIQWMAGNDWPDENSPDVAEAIIEPGKKQTFYLWPENNMPNYTEYTVNDKNYQDDPGFRPYVTYYPAAEGINVKGAVMICPGGAFMFRSWIIEGGPVATELNKLGYQCFVVGYRCDPWTQPERGYDLARAIRFARKNAEILGFDPKNIAVVGFSAGGILCGETLQNCSGLVNGTKIDPTYVPDTLDTISADAAAAGMGYSFYGILSHASVDVEKLASSNLPPTYYFHGDGEVFFDEITKNIQAVNEAGVATDRLVLPGEVHGFGGINTDWFAGFDAFMMKAFES